MSTAQKIIKYCAEAFALFLAVTIISSVVIAGYKILSTVGLITTENENIETKIISKQDDKIVSLKININNTNVEIKEGSKLEVSTNNNDLIYENEEGNIDIVCNLCHNHPEVTDESVFMRSYIKGIVCWQQTLLNEARKKVKACPQVL